MKTKIAVVTVFLVLYSAVAGTQGQKLPGDNIVIPSIDEKWGAVKFTHQQHLPFSDCTYCHHTNEGLTLESFNAGKVSKIPLCAECHPREEGKANTPKSSDGVELWSKEAYHINCIDCHKGEITKKPKNAGAVKKLGSNDKATRCADCHEVK